MKISRINSASLFALFALLTIGISLVALPAVSAHSPALAIPTWTYVSVSPNPVGVNQMVTFDFWNTLAPPVANNTNNIRWNFSVTVTDPNGVATNLGTSISDVNGESFDTFTPTVVGNWTVTVTFPVTVYKFNSSVAEQVWTNDTFATSSATAKFAVQSSAVPEVAGVVPSDVWLPKAAAGEDFSWFKWSTNYLGAASPQGIGNRKGIIQDNMTVSLTPHVLWTRTLEDGGMVGGDRVGIQGNAFYMGLAYSMRFLKDDTLILDGRLYYREPVGNTGTSTGYVVVDMRNGKELFRRSDITALDEAYSCNGVHLIFGTANFGTPRDPASLDPVGFTLTGVPTISLGGYAIGALGENLRLQYNTNASLPTYVGQWNSSRVLIPGLQGTVPANLPNAYDFNISVTYNGQPFSLPFRNILSYQPGDYLLTTNLAAGFVQNVQVQGDFWPGPFPGNITLYQVSLKPATMGQIVFNQTFIRNTSPFLNTSDRDAISELSYSGNLVDKQAHEMFLWGIRSLEWYGINFDTGAVWGPTAPEAPLQYYAHPDNGTSDHQRDAYCGNGYLMDESFAGRLDVYNSSTGVRLYELGLGGTITNENRTSTGFQTVYGDMPGQQGLYTLSNGKTYAFVSEHSPNTPLLKTAQMRCIDVATGTEDWRLSSYGGVWSLYVDTMIGGSGYLVQLNNYDENIYCVGQGPTVTTVVGPQNATEAGQKMIIDGTVIDTSPGTKTGEREGRFPNGVAAVSDAGDNMTAWMEYVYMNRPKPQVTGVPVTLSVVDSAGTATDIGTVTSDSTGYYTFLYTPETAGNFTVVARFDGSKGYYASAAQTNFEVTAAPPVPQPPVAEPPPMTDTYVLASAIGIIVAIAIVGAVVIMLLKKR